MKTLIETRPKVTVAFLFLGLTAAAFATAADLRMPADYPTILAAVNAADTKDTIPIAVGVYTGWVVVARKKPSLAGAPGAVIRARAGRTEREIRETCQ